MKKRGIRYLRFSSKDQSNYSIEWQDMNTLPWFQRNGVELLDTFIDKGKSAKTFDRPDMQKLTEFITTYHRTVDYLVVDRMDRFSRDAGEAMTTVKMLQRKYAVQIVSVSEGITYDYYDNDSFLRTGLSFLFAEEENRKRSNNIRGGIHTAKKKEGRYLGPAPVGYKNAKDGRKPILIVDEEKAPIIQYIYQAFLNDVPMYLIKKDAKKMGLKNSGNSAIARILSSPIYTGLLLVKAYKEYPEELVEGIHPSLISRTTWFEVQNKMKPGKAVQIINDDFPLRSVLLCHCGRPITGAKSKGKLGKYYDYYKCQNSKHNNVSTKKAHLQLIEAFGYMSLPDHLYTSILEKSEQLLESQMKSDAAVLRQRRGELSATESRLISIEKKWIDDQMAYDTYQRHYTNLTSQLHSLRAEIERLSRDQNDIWKLLNNDLYKLKSIPDLYNTASTTEKQQLVRLVFDSRLYYQENIYRTPYIIDVLSHNSLILKQKQLLVLEEKTGSAEQIPCGRAYGSSIEPSLLNFLYFLRKQGA